MNTLRMTKFVYAFVYVLGMLSFASCSNEDTMGKDIPYASFEMSATSAQTEDLIQFSSTTTGGSGSYTYAWNFGDGSFSEEPNPVHTYMAKGIYTVKLEVTDGAGKINSYSKNIEIVQRVAKIGDLELKWVAASFVSSINSNAPALSPDGKIVYMTSSDQVVHAYDTSTGSEYWAFDMAVNGGDDVPKTGSYCTPSVDVDGTIYVTAGWGGNGKLYAINPDGSKKWVAGSDAETGFWNKGATANAGMRYGSPAFDDNYVYCGNGGATGSMVVFDKRTGKRVGFITNAAGTAGPAGGITQGPVVNSNGFMYLIGTQYGMFGLEQNNIKTDNTFTPFAWQKLNDADLKDFGGVSSACYASPAINAEGNCVLMTYSKNLEPLICCIDPAGIKRWVTAISNTGKQDQGGVVIGTDGTIYASLKSTGEALGGIVALNNDGSVKWRYEISESVSGTPAVDKAGHIMFGTENGNFYIISNDGKDVLSSVDVAGLIMQNKSATSSEWTATRGKFWCSPIIDDSGVIYIGLTNLNNPTKSQVVALVSNLVAGPADSVWPMRGKDARHDGTIRN